MLTKDPTVHMRQVRGQWYLVKKQTAFQLNELGSYIWSLIDGSHAPDTIVVKVAERLENQEYRGTNISADVNDFLQQLLDLALISDD